MLEWLRCVLTGGHKLDMPGGRAHWHVSRKPSRVVASEKTRCMACHTTFYVSETRRGRRWRGLFL
jgi:hypothetical protein